MKSQIDKLTSDEPSEAVKGLPANPQDEADRQRATKTIEAPGLPLPLSDVVREHI